MHLDQANEINSQSYDPIFFLEFGHDGVIWGACENLKFACLTMKYSLQAQ
jgi:hypothetical protein